MSIKQELVQKLRAAVDILNASVRTADSVAIDESRNEVDMVLEELQANGVVMYPTSVENLDDELKETFVTFRFDTSQA